MRIIKSISLLKMLQEFKQMSFIGILFFGCFAVQQAFSECAYTNSGTTDESNLISDYYWREYAGIIPNDAIPGGFDKAGRKTYIGQVFNKSAGLLPASIYPGSKSAVYSDYGLSLQSEDFVKILCSRNPDRYNWILTKTEDTHLLTDCHLVIGGTQEEYPVYIARVRHEMETVIGKAFAEHSRHRGLYIPYKGKQVKYFSYEILAYNCKVNQYYKYSNITSVGVV